MCDLIFDVISCVFEAVIQVKSIYIIKSCMKARKNMEIK